MLNDIWKKDNIKYTNKIYPKYNYIKTLHNNYLNSSITYYSFTNRIVKRPNILVTLLEKLNIDTTKSVTDNYLNLLDTAEYYANEVGITTTVSKKTDFITSTIVKDMSELFLYISEDFDIEDTTYHTSVNAIFTTIDNIYLTHPSNYTLTKDTDFTIYTIDVIKLAISYYHWSKEQLFTNLDTDPARYVFEVVNNFTQYSLADYSILNSYLNYLKGIYPYFKDDNPFTVKDISSDLVKMFKYTKDVIDKNTHIDYYKYFYNIPLLVNDTVADIIDIPNILYNRRNILLPWVARLELLYHLLETIDDKPNQHRISKLMKAIRYNKSDKIYSTTNSYLQEYIDNYLTMITKLL